MKNLLVVSVFLFASIGESYSYVESNFFSKFAQLQKVANLKGKPIVIVAGFEGCVGCDELKEKVKKGEAKFKKIAEFFWMSTLAPESFLFYNSLGIKSIDSAPRTYLVKPHSNQAIPMDRQIDIGTIQKIMKH